MRALSLVLLLFLSIQLASVTDWERFEMDDGESLTADSESMDTRGRYVQTGPNFSPAQAAAGGILEISASVSGTQMQDGSKTSRYDVWAESLATEETYYIARNQTAIASNLEVTWQIPPTLPTGTFSICIDQDVPSMVEDWWSGEPSSESESCSGGLQIKRYNIRLSVDQEHPLPGEDLRVQALITNALDGSPESPEVAQWQISYTTDDPDGGFDNQRKTGILGSDPSSRFGFLLPSNIVTSQTIQVKVWANGSGGDQVEMAQLSLEVGMIEIEFTRPSHGSVLSLGDTFIFSLEAQRESNIPWSYYTIPEADIEVDVRVVQDQINLALADNLVSDGDGVIAGVATLPAESNFEDGPAVLRVEWRDPIDQSDRNSTSSIYISTGSSSSAGSGLGIEVTAEVTSSTEIGPGGTIQVSVRTIDDKGSELPSMWIHYRTTRQSYGHNDQGGHWQTARTDVNGRVTINVSVPTDLHPGLGDLRLQIIGWNSTGTSDTVNLALPVLSPELTISPVTTTWLPGETIEVEVLENGMDGSITCFWSVHPLDAEGQVNFNAGSRGTFSVTIPESFDTTSYISIMATSIDARGSIDSDSTTIIRKSGYSIAVLPPVGIPHGGEVAEFEYQIKQLDPADPIDYPLSWSAQIVGLPDSGRSGSLDTSNGIIEMMLPNDIVSGVYIVSFSMENGPGTMQVIQIRSEADGTGVSGAFASTSDAIRPAASILSLLALVLGATALVLTLLRGGGEEDDLGLTIPGGGHLGPPGAAGGHPGAGQANTMVRGDRPITTAGYAQQPPAQPAATYAQPAPAAMPPPGSPGQAPPPPSTQSMHDMAYSHETQGKMRGGY